MATSTVLKEALLSRSLLGKAPATESCSRPDCVSFFGVSAPAFSRKTRLFRHSQESSRALSPRGNSAHVRRNCRGVVCAGGSETSTQALDVPLESEIGVSYEALRDLLAAGEWEKADDETRRLICVLAGEEAVKRKWVYFTEVQYIPATDLLTIDALWRKASGDRFGFSIQRRLWNSLGKRWKPFFLKIEWTYGENSTYKKFPMEFSWDISAPVGHLPLTNALRGTQLIENLLSHPAFLKFDAESTMPVAEAKTPASSSSTASETSTSKKVEPNSDSSSVLGEIFSSADYGF